MLPRREENHNGNYSEPYNESCSSSLVEAAEAGVAGCADGAGLVLGGGNELGLGGRVSGDSGGTEADDSETEDEGADDDVFHGSRYPFD